jgi:hypothetical protein
MDSDDIPNGPHEGEWIYVSTPLGHLNGTARALADGIASAIFSRGWTVIQAQDQAHPDGGDPTRAAVRALEALCSADACLFDVSSSAVTEDAAVCAGRPVIALEHVDTPRSETIVALLRNRPLSRVIQYTTVNTCLEQLNQMLEDPAWLAAVSLAAADVL